jgi:hypothetical protein
MSTILLLARQAALRAAQAEVAALEGTPKLARLL